MGRSRTYDSQNQHNKQMDGFTIRTIVCCIVLALLFATFLISAANAASTSLRVTARILPWMDLSAVPRVASYQVDAEDIERGYVELPNSLTIRMATNIGSEVDLSLDNFGPGRVLVANGNFPGSDLIRMDQLSSSVPVSRNFDLRVMLPPGIEQGGYPLQLNVSAVNI
ncbi:MAG TPA: hypothetical protein VJ910_07645 [Desulfuromonadales bacterium]|nr:hypothetical protein [Desulfuromonadales bacterium]